jgi:hypothetical protein
VWPRSVYNLVWAAQSAIRFRGLQEGERGEHLLPY